MFEKFSKIPRLNKEVVISEKLDGTNAQVHIIHKDDPEWDDALSPHIAGVSDCGQYHMLAGSRNRYLLLGDDNFGFALWVSENAEELFKFGPGRHFGEWWGCGIQREYGLEEKRLSMFNPRWADQGPDCVTTVPVLYEGEAMIEGADHAMNWLDASGSIAAPGYLEPEGIVIYHTAAKQLFKQTFEMDGGKWNKPTSTS